MELGSHLCRESDGVLGHLAIQQNALEFKLKKAIASGDVEGYKKYKYGLKTTKKGIEKAIAKSNIF
ncbi:hypothetical protein C0583_03010 [Candidatus Parcubacteria bacterium]|nr:MAG: hypothetical protein C0583_03010 [Candidatus Parcubacteria bacterium]